MTTQAFEKAFKHTVGVEGGYSDHPSDRGGKTVLRMDNAAANTATHNKIHKTKRET